MLKRRIFKSDLQNVKFKNQEDMFLCEELLKNGNYLYFDEDTFDIYFRNEEISLEYNYICTALVVNNSNTKKVRFTTNFDSDFLKQLKIYAAKEEKNINELIENHFKNVWDKSCNTSHEKPVSF